MPGLIVYLKYLTAIGVCLFGVGLPFRLGGGCFVRDFGCLGMRFHGVILWFKSRAGARDRSVVIGIIGPEIGSGGGGFRL